MHQRAQEFRDRVADTYGISVEVQELPSGTKTAQDAADAIGCDLEQIVKSMAMSVGDDIILVLTSGPNRVDEARLASLLDVEESVVSPGDPNQVKDHLGWSIGGVPPIAHDESVDTYLDADLLEYDVVWAGAGTPKAVFSIDTEVLQQLTEAEVVDVFTTG